MNCSYEKDNPSDVFSITVLKAESPGTTVGHLPMEISRITKYIIDQGSQVEVKVLGRHYRRSPLVQAGLEVPCRIKITMLGSIVNHLLLVRYETLLKDLYIEPDEAIIGTFLSIRNEHENIEEMEIEIEVQEIGPPKKTGQKKEKKEKKSKDNRDMFRNPRYDSRKETAEKRDTIIVID